MAIEVMHRPVFKLGPSSRSKRPAILQFGTYFPHLCLVYAPSCARACVRARVHVHATYEYVQSRDLLRETLGQHFISLVEDQALESLRAERTYTHWVVFILGGCRIKDEQTT